MKTTSRRTRYLRYSYYPSAGCRTLDQIVATMSEWNPGKAPFVRSLMFYRISMEGRDRRNLRGRRYGWSGFPYLHQSEISEADFLKCVAKADYWYANLKTATLDRWIRESDALQAAEQADFPK